VTIWLSPRPDLSAGLSHTAGGLAVVYILPTVIAIARQSLTCQSAHHGINGDTMMGMAMTLRLADDESEALRRRAELEHRSMQEVARQAIREYVENHSRAEVLNQVLDEELPRYAEALQRLGQ
jgi:hypothetical protein